MSDDENFIVEGLELAKRIIKGLKGLDAEIKSWQTLQKPKVDEPRDMKDVTPKKRIPDAIDVKYHVTESTHPSRDKERPKTPPK